MSRELAKSLHNLHSEGARVTYALQEQRSSSALFLHNLDRWRQCLY